jgi:hypothetical protein
VTLHNEDGFRLDFTGSWGMPYRSYRIATRAAPDGAIERRPAINAVVDCDQIANYGFFLKLLGLSEWETGLMHITGGADMSVWSDGPLTPPEGIGRVAFELGPDEAVARVTGGRLRAGEHAVGLLLVDAGSGRPVSLSYAFVTSVETDAEGVVTAVRVHTGPGAVRGPVRAYYLVDTVPAAVARLAPGGAGKEADSRVGRRAASGKRSAQRGEAERRRAPARRRAEWRSPKRER